MRLADGQDVRTDPANQLIFALQSGWIADPDAPGWIGVRTRDLGFTDATSLQENKSKEQGPERSAKQWDPPTSGRLREGPGPSLGPAFLGEDRFDPRHLITQHGLHLFRLVIHLNKHLLLQIVHLG